MLSLQDVDEGDVADSDDGSDDREDGDGTVAEAVLDANEDSGIGIDGDVGAEVDLEDGVGAGGGGGVGTDANVDLDAICATRTSIDADDAAETAADVIGPD